MSGFTLRPRLSRGDKIFAAWISSTSARVAEATVAAGFDAAIFDLQHGEVTLAEAREGIAAVKAAGRPCGARVGLDGHAEAARVLDLGGEIVIMPMINSAEDAKRFVDTVRFPPLGARSWGPTRALGVLGMSAEDYRSSTDENAVALAMIETRAAVDSLEAILDVPGLDGVFVGPSDLSISLSGGKTLDHRMPEAVAVMERLVQAVKKRGKLSGIFCAGGEAAARNAAMGFDLLAVGSDLAFLAEGARLALKAARGDAERGAESY